MEMTMHDFAAQVGATVRTTRELRQQQSETSRREGEGTAGRLRGAQAPASGLAGTTWEHVRTAVHASDGALAVDRSQHQGVTVFELRWQEGRPARALQITVDPTDGMIQAAWLVPPGYGRSVGSSTVAASGFEISKLDSVILLLVDQSRWDHGAVPTIPW
jgi:hypothetical protein